MTFFLIERKSHSMRKYLGNEEKSCCFRVCGGRDKLMQRPPLIFTAGGKTICSGRCAPSILENSNTITSLSQRIKFRAFGYKDTHFPPHFGRKKHFCNNNLLNFFRCAQQQDYWKFRSLDISTERSFMTSLKFGCT